MELIIEWQQESCTIALAGELDLHSCLVLDEAINKILRQGHSLKNLFMDCRHLHYISSAGLGVFISYLQELELREIVLTFYGMNKWVHDIFKITGLDSYVSIIDLEEMQVH